MQILVSLSTSLNFYVSLSVFVIVTKYMAGVLQLPPHPDPAIIYFDYILETRFFSREALSILFILVLLPVIIVVVLSLLLQAIS